KPETKRLLLGSARSEGFLQQFAKEQEAESAAILPAAGGSPVDSWGPYQKTVVEGGPVIRARAPVMGDTELLWYAELSSPIPRDAASHVSSIEDYNTKWIQLRDHFKSIRLFYTMLMTLITLFVLFLATWIALFTAKQISVPISALLHAASEVRKG